MLRMLRFLSDVLNVTPDMDIQPSTNHDLGLSENTPNPKVDDSSTQMAILKYHVSPGLINHSVLIRGVFPQ